MEIVDLNQNIIFRATQNSIKTIICRLKLFVDRVRHRIRFYVYSVESKDAAFVKLFSIPSGPSNSIKLVSDHFSGRARPILFVENVKDNDQDVFQKESLICARDRIIREANRVTDHSFEFLGASVLRAGQTIEGEQSSTYIPIDWHVDFKTGYRWNQKKFYLDIEIPQGKADIKIPWELSRFQHLSILGQAYRLTGDEKYTEEFINQINDWIEHNQPQRGVNWSCTMDVAIRAVNWITGYYFFKDSKVISEDFLIKFLKSLFVHGRHIADNLENRTGLTNNHYLSDVVGLLYLGVLFPEFKDAKRWKEFGLQELKKEIQKQTYGDGCNFEGSTCYHRLALELFFYPALLMVINNESFDGENYKETMERIFGNNYSEKLYKMFDAVLYLLMPNNQMPQIGDNDNGRLHKFSSQETLDMRYLLNFGAIFFGESRFKINEFGFSEEAFWVFGEEGRKIWDGLDENRLINISSHAFSVGGWFVLRNFQDYMVISAGPNGLNGLGGHNHNDKLSFELIVGGKEIIVDPGTYVYTSEPKMRNLFRSTAYHNTVVIDEIEQNRFNERSLFKLENDASAKCFKWDDNLEESLFIGEHNGYARLREPIVHRRSVRFLKSQSKWTIKDEFYRLNNEGALDCSMVPLSSEHAFNWYFHLAPQVSVESTGKFDFLLKNENVVVIFRIVSLPPQFQCVIEEGWFSPAYGEKIKGSILKLSCSCKIPFDVELEITKLSL